MAKNNEVKFYLLEREKGTVYKGGYKNEPMISSTNSLLNTYFNIDVQQSAYFTMLIEGFEYGRFKTQIEATTPSGAALNNGRHDYYFDTDPTPNIKGDGSLGKNMKYTDNITDWVQKNAKFAAGANGSWQNFNRRRSVNWLPLK